jgi:hypothetical protein
MSDLKTNPFIIDLHFASTFKSRTCHRDIKAFKRACKEKVSSTMTKKLVAL